MKIKYIFSFLLITNLHHTCYGSFFPWELINRIYTYKPHINISTLLQQLHNVIIQHVPDNDDEIYWDFDGTEQRMRDIRQSIDSSEDN